MDNRYEGNMRRNTRYTLVYLRMGKAVCTPAPAVPTSLGSLQLEVMVFV